MNPVDAIRSIALRSFIDPDGEASLRRIFRWYSKNFSTPLAEVENLDLEHVLLNYFEAIYEEMEPPEIEAAIAEVLESEEERKARQQVQKRIEASDDEFLKAAAEEAQKEAQKEKEKLENAKKLASTPSLPEPPPEIEELPDISVKFDDNLDNWGDEDPLGIPARPPKKT